MKVHVLALLAPVFAQFGRDWQQGRCTYHPYEEDMKSLGNAYDNSPGWCGIRYTMLNVARIVAVHGLGAGNCNMCLEMANANGGPSVYILAVDQKGDPGLDVAKSSFQAAFPNSNALDPEVCKWRVVDHSFCGGICVGAPEECTEGQRNLLPGYLLPKLPPAVDGLNVGNSQGHSGDGNGGNTPATSAPAALVPVATTTKGVATKPVSTVQNKPIGKQTTIVSATTLDPQPKIPSPTKGVNPATAVVPQNPYVPTVNPVYAPPVATKAPSVYGLTEGMVLNGATNSFIGLSVLVIFLL
ncbi:hypothetical protein HDV04_000834 [Boothiomyces sp. JEL0838]|nr:hypothetical protein HDV04_000834 [Boothiomyces sp. JEL0838]